MQNKKTDLRLIARKTKPDGVVRTFVLSVAAVERLQELAKKNKATRGEFLSALILSAKK